MLKKILLVLIYLFLFGCSSGTYLSEEWIDYDHISKLRLGMSKDEIVSILGKPILVLADSEYDKTLYFFYNYHIKKYNLDNSKISLNKRSVHYERSTLLKFTFIDEDLTSWEEDKMTLSMASKVNTSNKSYIQYATLLLNLIMIIKIF